MAQITMPKMGFDMQEGTIVRWLKKVGDEIKKGEAIAEIETDKVTIEIEAFASGTLTEIVANEGAVVPVGEPIAILGSADEAAATPKQDQGVATAVAEGQESGEDVPREMGEGGESASRVAQETEAAANRTAGQRPAAPRQRAGAAPGGPQRGYGSDVSTEQQIRGAPAQAPAGAAASPVGESLRPAGDGRDGGHIAASPVAKRLAQENNVNLAQITGTGPGGRIVRRDVEAFVTQPTAAPAPAPQPPAAPAPQPAPATAPQPVPAPAAQPAPAARRREPLSRLRQTIARRMVQSKTQAPHFYVTSAIDMSAAMELRKQLNALEGVKISVNDMVVKAAALALKQFPSLNATFAEDAIEYFDQIHVSIAVATDNGLLAPAITDVDKKALGVLAAEARDLAERTRAGKATPEELGRGTFTVSNLGMFGVESFVAIINPPQAAILAVGAAADTPVVKDGQVAIAPIMHATISVDHRVSDGVVGAQYLQALKALLESPMRLLI